MEALRKAIEARKRQKLLGEDERESSSSSSSSSSEEEEEVEQASEPSSSEKKEEESNDNNSTLDPSTAEYKIINWLHNTMQDWLEDLAEQEARGMLKTAVERAALTTAKECEQQLEPLLVLLQKRAVDPGMLAHLEIIVQKCEEREYRQALEQFIQLTIGNAPWPIGVTMVGIHARSGREKIAENKIKHLMKDPVARAYMMSVKRLMTRHQAIFPPSAPSKRMTC